MAHNEVQTVKKRSFISILSLFGQSSYSALLGFTAFFVLTAQSGAYLLGIYSTVLSTLSFFNYISDLGLAAAIMQKKEVKSIDLNTVFIMQTVLSIFAVVLGFALTPLIMKFYKDLPYSAVYLYWAVLVSFFFITFKTIPSLLLEKEIQIYKVVVAQIIENTVFYVIVIAMVFMGYDIEALIVAVLSRAVVGMVVIFFMRPWTPKWEFSWSSAKQLLAYGIPFQGNSFLALIKDDLLILYLGGVIGFTNLGYVAFAKKYAEFSIRLIMDNINRVAFPIFAKYNSDKQMLTKSVHKILFYDSIFVFPIVIGALFIFESLLHVIPKTGYFIKWQPALFSFYFFSLSAFFVSLTTPFVNLFNAVGNVKLSLKFMILWTIVTWTLIPLAVAKWGYNGISVSFFLQSLTFVFVYHQAKRYVDISLMKTIGLAVKSTFVMACYLGLLFILLRRGTISPIIHLAFSMPGAVLIYAGTLYATGGKKIIEEGKSLLALSKS